MKKPSRPAAAASTTSWLLASATTTGLTVSSLSAARPASACARNRASSLPSPPRPRLTRESSRFVHPQEFLSIEDLFAPDPANSTTARLLLALDGVEDPQNLGALLRVADGAGVDGVVLTERRSAPLSPAAVKASAGAAEHLRIARVVNLVRALEDLKRQNLWIVGLDERGATDYDQFDFTGNLVIVLGREGAGLHDLVRRTCDHFLRIPMAGGVSSLNVSAAGAVVLYEAARQRRALLPEPPPDLSKRLPHAVVPHAMLPRPNRKCRKVSVHEVSFAQIARASRFFTASAIFASQRSRASPQSPPAPRVTDQDQQPHGQVIFSRSTDENGQTSDHCRSRRAANLPASPSPHPTATDAERRAVTFTAFNMDVHLRPAEHHIAVRALLTVRNDGKSPLAHIPLQISSSLHWERIRLGSHDVAFTVATLNSDVDHTGQLHEAAIPLATPLAPGATLQLDVTYSGAITAIRPAPPRHRHAR